MPGFIIHIGKEHLSFAPETRKSLTVDKLVGNGFCVERRVINKFMNDRLFYEDDAFVVVVEGVVLNNHELVLKYRADGWKDCVKRMYRQSGEAFFNEFRGSFSGLLFDKALHKWLIFTDHVGDKQIFYSKTQDGYLIGSEMGFIVETRKLNELPVSIDEVGCYMSLTQGFCIEDRTLVSEVRKLFPGHYLRIDNVGIEERQYHHFNNTPNEDLTLDDAIDGIDVLFRQALKRAFDKDCEYGFRHIACLSGGLDSRMTVWVGDQLGYSDQLNLTYSQSGYLDFSVAQQIATDLHHDWLFKPLDGGDCIKDIDDVSRITYGSANFLGLAHGRSMENLINYDSFGVIHTGQLGDVIIGSYLNKLEGNANYSIVDGAYSQEVIDFLLGYKERYSYENKEVFIMYNRGFCGIGQGLLTFQENSESYSPFMDVDFFEFCYSIPLKWRLNHKIYFDWILNKYPGAADYVWEHTGKKISSFENIEHKYLQIAGKRIPAFGDPGFPAWLKGSILRRLGLRKKGQKAGSVVMSSNFSMNPVDYWYRTNPRLKAFMDEYWEVNHQLIPEGRLRDDMMHLYKDCVVNEKLQSLSVLSAMKLILS